MSHRIYKHSAQQVSTCKRLYDRMLMIKDEIAAIAGTEHFQTPDKAEDLLQPESALYILNEAHALCRELFDLFDPYDLLLPYLKGALEDEDWIINKLDDGGLTIQRAPHDDPETLERRELSHKEKP